MKTKEEIERDREARAPTIVISTAVARARGTFPGRRGISEGVGSESKAIDKTVPESYTKVIYNSLKSKEAKILTQFRTGHNRLNPYLKRIGMKDSTICDCGATKETVKHFLWGCGRWTTHRNDLRSKWPEKQGNIQFFLGGKDPNDSHKWTPNIEAI